MTTKREAKMPYLVVSAEIFLPCIWSTVTWTKPQLAHCHPDLLSQPVLLEASVLHHCEEEICHHSIHHCILNGRPDRVGYWIATKEELAYIDDLVLPANTLLKIKNNTALAFIMDIVMNTLEQYWRPLIDVEHQRIMVYSQKVFWARHGSWEDGLTDWRE